MNHLEVALAARAHRGGRGPHNLGGYVLSGLCCCGHCGRPLSGVPS